MAVAVVSKGKVIHIKGYGLRDVDAKLPVTFRHQVRHRFDQQVIHGHHPATLAKQGKIEWDRQVRDYLPAFRMYDPVVTERMTIRDLVTHRSGLARHDLMWAIGVYSREQLLERLRYLQPNRDFPHNVAISEPHVHHGRLFGRQGEWHIVGGGWSATMCSSRCA